MADLRNERLQAEPEQLHEGVYHVAGRSPNLIGSSGRKVAKVYRFSEAGRRDNDGERMAAQLAARWNACADALEAMNNASTTAEGASRARTILRQALEG